MSVFDYLEELYYGGLDPAHELAGGEPDDVRALRETLERRLDGQERELLRLLLSRIRGGANQAAYEHFCEGVRVGAGLAVRMFP